MRCLDHGSTAKGQILWRAILSDASSVLIDNIKSGPVSWSSLTATHVTMTLRTFIKLFEVNFPCFRHA